MKQFIQGVVVGGLFVAVANMPANQEIEFHMEKPANTVLPQFSYKSRSGEVIELRDEMEQEDGVYKRIGEQMRKAILKKRPDLIEEYDKAVEDRKKRIDNMFKPK